MNKFMRGVRWAKLNGQSCAYCRRTMRASDPLLFPTWDHTTPRSRGGKHVVGACYACNHIKADMTTAEWEKFMAGNPEWWVGVPKPYGNRGSTLAETMDILKYGRIAKRPGFARLDHIGAATEMV